MNVEQDARQPWGNPSAKPHFASSSPTLVPRLNILFLNTGATTVMDANLFLDGFVKNSAGF
jgi:hypothetical protein